MASLTTHLRRPADHGRLAFHPQCPVCCSERLAGALPAEPVVGRRTQALLATGVLALSTTTPTAVLAAEPDQEHEGTAPTEQAVGADPAADPGFDPGGETTVLPSDPAPAPGSPPAPDPDDDSGAVEQEPATDDVAPVVDRGDGTGTANAGGQPAAPATDPSAPAAAQPTTPETAAETAPDPETAGGPRAEKPETTRKGRPRARAAEPSGTDRAAAPQSEPVNVAGASAPTTIEVAQPASSAPAAVIEGRSAQRGDRSHVVLGGESLWSIARDLLGDGASVAAVAREVNRLWELNGDRIGTGDRDLLMVGTRLALR